MIGSREDLGRLYAGGNIVFLLHFPLRYSQIYVTFPPPDLALRLLSNPVLSSVKLSGTMLRKIRGELPRPYCRNSRCENREYCYFFYQLHVDEVRKKKGTSAKQLRDIFYLVLLSLLLLSFNIVM